MNYGRRKASKRQKEITSKGTMQGKRMGVRLFKAFLLLILVACVSVGVGGLTFCEKRSSTTRPTSLRMMYVQVAILLLCMRMTEPQSWNVSLHQDPTVSTSRLMRYQLIYSMHLSQLRTNVSMIIRELTHRVSCVPSL